MIKYDNVTFLCVFFFPFRQLSSGHFSQSITTFMYCSFFVEVNVFTLATVNL